MSTHLTGQIDTSPSTWGSAILKLDFPGGRAQPSPWRWVLATIIAVDLSLAAC
jgi:hypothetical protein